MAQDLATEEPTIIVPATQWPTIIVPGTLTPTDSPNHSPSPVPTVFVPSTVSPSESPKNPPTLIPSASSTDKPSDHEPTDMPTLSAELEFRDNIRMVLEGLPSQMSLTQQSEWEVVTSQHVRNYYAEYAAVNPELVPVHIKQ
jgi:hypothetical protein